MTDQRGARFLARAQHERAEDSPQSDAATKRATPESSRAPLAEMAAAHDGQAVEPWTRMLYQVLGLRAI